MARGDGGEGPLERLDEAITVLASGGVYLSREELLDALWLAGRLPERDAAGAPLERAAARAGVPLPDTRPAAPAVPASPAVRPAPARQTEAAPQDTAPTDPPPREREAPSALPDPRDRHRPAERAPHGLYGGGHTPGGPGADAESPRQDGAGCRCACPRTRRCTRNSPSAAPCARSNSTAPIR
ncbi:conserved hypothetical protein [Streptomyces himastatinicus ATCC 53653]|uniref:Uncharacterized protein n=1 Tax=Streptomyces himastatinicus ATCC 53653 TaxID=457427 RepID=D9WVJ1_9ACTN|nr:conserved hypothetical protein [Streptomyces himastatinicus ATCC 53653]